MAKELKSPAQKTLAAVRAALEESQQRERFTFGGLIKPLPARASRVLQDILADLRDHLLDKYGEIEARRLLEQYEPCAEFHWRTPVPDDVELALRLLNSIRSAMGCPQKRLDELILGKAGAQDQQLQAGRRKAGQKTGEERSKKAAANYAEWQQAARALRNSGRPERDLAGILAQRFGVSPSTIRKGLKKAGGS